MKKTNKALLPHLRLRYPEYGPWAAMLTRCRNPNVRQYKDYGGRGITVCARWFKFENFLADMRPRPPCPPDRKRGHAIERRDNNGNYEPGNCYWATYLEQAQNKRNNHNITAHNRTMSAAAWSKENGVHVQTILTRLRQCVPAERAVLPGRIPRSSYPERTAAGVFKRRR